MGEREEEEAKRVSVFVSFCLWVSVSSGKLKLGNWIQKPDLSPFRVQIYMNKAS